MYLFCDVLKNVHLFVSARLLFLISVAKIQLLFCRAARQYYCDTLRCWYPNNFIIFA